MLCFVLANTRIDPSLFSNCSIRSLYFFELSVFIISCLIFFDNVFSLSTDILSGFFKYFFDKVIMFLGNVAENIKVCFFCGINFKIWSIWIPKPISSIRSVSSKTRWVTFLRPKDPLSKWSFMRPGVPIIILGFLFNWDSCLLIASPPIRQDALIWLDWPNKSLTTLTTCFASSLVGVIISAHSSLVEIILSITGIAKAPVFPVPVDADPKRSRPSIINGIACAWIGVGFLNPILFKDVFRALHSPKFSKFSIKFPYIFRNQCILPGALYFK